MSPAGLKSLFAYKSSADRELFALLATVSSDRADELHTCIRTLNHIHVVDRTFRAHLGAEPRPFDATNTKGTPTLARLQADVAATDAWYEQYVADLAPTALGEVIGFEFTDGDRG